MNAAVDEPWQTLVLFDGTCAVCDATVTWILDHDPVGKFHFAPLQGPTAARVLARHPEIPAHLDSIVVIQRVPNVPDGERAFWHSAAILTIAAHLPAPWSWAALGRWVPSVARDLGYRAFAAIRYRVFGRLEACRIPDPRWDGRFLD
jgi:predicted DCC family thiol-disulfide oxidoreductase YuxK